MCKLFSDKTEITLQQALLLAENLPSKRLYVAFKSFGDWDSGAVVRGVDDLKKMSS